jgi:uncharacterized protein (DUF305 family)
MLSRRKPGFLAIGLAALLLGTAAGAAIVVTAAAQQAPGMGMGDTKMGKPGSDDFAGTMKRAMMRMDHGMNVPMTGDPDRDFARMMIPHHAGAIDMAQAELRFGKDERLRRLAQDIVSAQRQEIAIMRAELAKLEPAAK